MGRECPFCGLRFRRFISYPGEPSPLFTQEHIVGGGPCEQSRCPLCSSTQRQRLVFLYLKTRTTIFTDTIRLLHMAPENNLQRVLQSCANIEYVSADLNSPLASVRTDITAMSFGDKSFDVVVCNHVLEHIPDDRKAMRELARVLKPGGWAVLQVPIGAERTATEEDPWISNPDEQLRRFGQANHVRLYGRADYVRRLENVGFCVEQCSLSKQNGEAYVRRFGLLQDEYVFVARKPMSRSSLGSR